MQKGVIWRRMVEVCGVWGYRGVRHRSVRYEV